MMKSGMTFKQGEIVVIPFPFTDLSAVKQRPVLIISSTGYNESTEDVIICGITSNLKDAGYSVVIDNGSLSTGQIPVISRIKVDKIFTLKQSLAKKKVARIKPEVMDAVKAEILKLLEL